MHGSDFSFVFSLNALHGRDFLSDRLSYNGSRLCAVSRRAIRIGIVVARFIFNDVVFHIFSKQSEHPELGL